MENKKNNGENPMGKIVKLLGAVIGLIGLWFTYYSYKEGQGGDMFARLHEETLKTGAVRQVYVCLESQSTLEFSQMKEFIPRLANAGRHATKDMVCNISVNCSGCSVEPNADWAARNVKDTLKIRLSEDKVSNQSPIKFPFKKLKINSKSSIMSMSTDCLWNGKADSYQYTVRYNFCVVPRQKGMNDKRWVEACSSTLSTQRLASEFHLCCLSGNEVQWFDNLVPDDIYTISGRVNEQSFVPIPQGNEPSKAKVKDERKSARQSETMQRQGLSLGEVQHVFDCVECGTLTAGEAHGRLAKGNVKLASPEDDYSTLYDVLHAMEQGTRMGEPLHFTVESFSCDPATGKIKSGTLRLSH